MIIVGTKGFAKELLQVLYQRGEHHDVIFFDDVSSDLPDQLYGKFKILKNYEDVTMYIKNVDDKFALGLGDPKIRKDLALKFKNLKGLFTRIISPKTDIGVFNTHIGEGVNIMTGTVITNDVSILDGCLINLNCTIGHDTRIGKFTEMSPGVHISGNCKIGNLCRFGTGAVVLPKIKIGNNVTVGAGSVVTKDIDDNQTIAGVPAKPIVKK